MLVGAIGVPHMYTIVLGGYLPVILVGDIAYSNRVASGGASGRQVAKSPVGRQLGS